MTIGFARFNKQFASGGTTTPLTDAQAAAGWAFLGSAPPTVEEFNAMMQTFDDKDNWLYGNIQTLVTAAGTAAPADGVFTALKTALDVLYSRPSNVGNYAGVVPLAANTQLTPAHLGNAITWFGSNGGILTTPSDIAGFAGKTLKIYNYGGGTLTVQAIAGGDVLYNGSAISSVIMALGDDLELVGRGIKEFDIVGGSAARQFFPLKVGASTSGQAQAVPRTQADGLYAPVAGSTTPFTVGTPVNTTQALNKAYADTVYAAIGVPKQQFLTASGAFQIPPGVTTIYVSAVAGGASGGGGGGNSTTAGGGGGGGGGQGQQTVKQAFSVTPGQIATVVIGTGGALVAGGTNAGTAGTAGNSGSSTTVTGAFALSLAGGSGGFGGGGNTTTTGLVAGGNGGISGGSTNNGNGACGGPPSITGGNLPGIGGKGGGSLWGDGGQNRVNSTGNPGAGGLGYGAGGSGGNGGASTTGSPGGQSGPGANGALLIEW